MYILEFFSGLHFSHKDTSFITQLCAPDITCIGMPTEQVLINSTWITSVLHASLRAIWFLTLSDCLNAFSLSDFNLLVCLQRHIYKAHLQSPWVLRIIFRSLPYKELQMGEKVRISWVLIFTHYSGIKFIWEGRTDIEGFSSGFSSVK